MTAGAPSLGVVLPEHQPIEDDIQVAQLAEEAGLATVWCYELTRDSQVRAACVAQHTSRIEVGTCVSLWHATPVSAAMRTAEIQRWAGGRFRFGIGVGTEASNRDHHGTTYTRPAARMAEYLQVLSGAWEATADRPLTFGGASFEVTGYPGADLGGRRPPPVLLAAIGPAMIRLAITEADGIVLSPSATPRYTRGIQAQNRAALDARATSGRPFTTTVVTRCSIDPDRRVARERARRSIAWYAVIPAHARIAGALGFGAEVGAIAAAWRRDDAEAAVSAVSDDMVDTFSLAGTADDVRREIRRWDGVVDALALITPTEGTPPDEALANAIAITTTFA